MGGADCAPWGEGVGSREAPLPSGRFMPGIHLDFLLKVPFLVRAFLLTVLHFWEDAGPTQSLCSPQPSRPQSERKATLGFPGASPSPWWLCALFVDNQDSVGLIWLRFHVWKVKGKEKLRTLV